MQKSYFSISLLSDLRRRHQTVRSRALRQGRSDRLGRYPSQSPAPDLRCYPLALQASKTPINKSENPEPQANGGKEADGRIGKSGKEDNTLLGEIDRLLLLGGIGAPEALAAPCEVLVSGNSAWRMAVSQDLAKWMPMPVSRA